MRYETLSPEQARDYYALDMRPEMCRKIHERFPEVNVLEADCQEPLDFPDGFFDRILAIHVLEHLPDLPRAIQEIYRLCDKKRGRFCVIIPCQGGKAYAFCSKISAQRMWKKRYHLPYSMFIGREHLSVPEEVLEEIHPYFKTERRSFFPLRVPAIFCNLVIGYTFVPRATPLAQKKEVHQ